MGLLTFDPAGMLQNLFASDPNQINNRREKYNQNPDCEWWFDYHYSNCFTTVPEVGNEMYAINRNKQKKGCLFHEQHFVAKLRLTKVKSEEKHNEAFFEIERWTA